MSRYVPTPGQRGAIDALRLAGYAVVRQATHDGLKRRVDESRWQVEREREIAEGARRWALDCSNQERRLSDRLNEVCTAAAALGVPIDAINAALAAGDANFQRRPAS